MVDIVSQHSLISEEISEERDPYDNIRRYHHNTLGKYQKYGINQAVYADMLKAQNYTCAICGNPETDIVRGKVKELAIDHCHNTNKVRALLCGNCNRALGLLKEDAERVRNMLRYIEERC